MHHNNVTEKYRSGILALALRGSIFTAALLAPCVASAATKTWIGTTALMGTAANWSPSGVPNFSTSDVIQFNGSSLVAGLTFTGAIFNDGANSGGLGGILMTAAQTGSISISKTDAGSTFRFAANAGITIEAGAGAFSLGTSGSAFTINVGQGPPHAFSNNSSNVATIGNLVTFSQSGGNTGGGGKYTFTGTGDWLVAGVFNVNVLQLSKDGTGTLTLSNANLNLGTTTVSGGVMRLNHATALTGGIGATGGLTALTINGGVIGLGNGDFSRGLGTEIAQVRFTGSGGFAAYTADRSVNLGGASAAVTWGTGSFIPANSNLILGADDADKTATFQNAINLGAAIRTIQVDNGSANIDGIVSGVLSNGGLTKTGNGTLALTVNNTYSLGTTINAGMLLANNTSGSATGTANIIVNGTGSLGGFGVVSGEVTINAGGSLAPGNSIDSLRTGALILNANSIYQYELDTAALNGDLTVVAGNLTIDSAATLSLTELASGIVNPGDKISLINYSGVWNGTPFNGYADDSNFLLGSNTWTINYNDSTGGLNYAPETISGSFVTITAVAIPEPGTLAVILFGTASICLLRLKRRSSLSLADGVESIPAATPSR